MLSSLVHVCISGVGVASLKFRSAQDIYILTANAKKSQARRVFRNTGSIKNKNVEILPSPVYQYKMSHEHDMALPLSPHFGIGEPPAARGFT